MNLRQYIDGIPVDMELKHVVIGVVMVLIGLAPFVVGRVKLGILTQILIFAYFGIAFNLAFGFSGLPSFGHHAFFGLGAFGFAVFLREFPETVWIAVVLTVFIAFVASFIVGWFSLRGVGIYFALITFAFAQVLYEVVTSWQFTGGTLGLPVALPGELLGMPTWGAVFYGSWLMLMLLVAFSYRLLNSPLGTTMQSLALNAERAEAIGYDVRKIRLVVFTFSGGITSIAGILYAAALRLAVPYTLSIELILDLFLVVIVGGVSSLVGPFVGAVFVILLEEALGGAGDWSFVITGFILIVVMLFARGGIVELFKNAYQRTRGDRD